MTQVQAALSTLLEQARTGALTINSDLAPLRSSVASVLQAILEFHPDASRPGPAVQVAYDARTVQRSCAQALLDLTALPSAPTRLVERLRSALAAANALCAVIRAFHRCLSLFHGPRF